MISKGLLVYLAFLPIFFVAVHVAACRFFKRNGELSKPQLLLLRMVLYFNVPVLVGMGAIAFFENRPLKDLFYMALYGMCCFNLFGYAYFHFFNLSETARRVKMLILLKRGDAAAIDRMPEAYRSDEMLKARLKRLESMDQIQKGEDGRLRLRSKTLLSVAFLIDFLRKLLGFSVQAAADQRG